MNDEKASDSPRHVYDILIVGAGPVGLAVAIGLRKRGITNILVIDQASEFRRVGQGVDLLPNGLRAIKYTDSGAYERIKETVSKIIQPPKKKPFSSSGEAKEEGAPPSKRFWRQRNLQGEVTRSFPQDFQSWFDRYGEGRVSLSWFDLQTTMRSLLPTEIVKVNHRCVHIEEESEWARIDSISNAKISLNPFSHWDLVSSNVLTSESIQESNEAIHKSFYAKLVVAADGINSTIRQVLYENKGLGEYAKPQYSGIGIIGCFQIENIPQSIVEELDANYLQGEQIATIINTSDFDSLDLKHTRVILFRRSETTLGYVINAPYNLDCLINSSPSEIIDLGLEALKNARFFPVFPKLVSLSNPECTFRRPYYMHPISQASWSQGRVVLVGDAAHGMPPFMGQGSNQGLEDAAVIVTFIAKLIQNNGLDQENEIADIFEKYEQIRKPFMEQIQAKTMTNHSLSQQEWDDFNEILHRREYPSSVTLGEHG